MAVEWLASSLWKFTENWFIQKTPHPSALKRYIVRMRITESRTLTGIKGLWASDSPVESYKVFYPILESLFFDLSLHIPICSLFRGFYAFCSRYGGMLSSNNPMLYNLSGIYIFFPKNINNSEKMKITFMEILLV